jgi:hypothetical protein
VTWIVFMALLDMPLSEQRMPEQNRNQDLGGLSAQPSGALLPPATCADLLDPALWQDGLAKYARATSLAAACPSRERRYASVSPAPGVHLCQPLAFSLQLHRMKLAISMDWIATLI